MEHGYIASSFDLLGVADLDLIEQARRRCRTLVVGVFSDEYVRALTGIAPVMSLGERLALVSRVIGVQAAKAHDETTAELDPVRFRVSRSHGSDGQGLASPLTPAAPKPGGLTLVADEHGPAAAESSDTASHTGLRGYVPGAWDMFHIGHLRLLERSRDRCDLLVAGVVTDEVLHRAKGKWPMVPLTERLRVVSAMQPVDAAVVDTSSDKSVAWRSRPFDVIFKGDDWRGTPKGERLEQQMASVGARVCYLPYTAHISSTALRRLLHERLVAGAGQTVQ